MNAVDYNAKVHDLLIDTESYDLLKSDPTRVTERNLFSSLRSMRNENKISEALYNRVRPSEGSSKPDLFYGRVKLHKEAAPLQPVAATCGTSAYQLAHSLASIFRPFVVSSGRILRNIKDLVDVFSEVVVQEDEILQRVTTT